MDKVNTVDEHKSADTHHWVKEKDTWKEQQRVVAKKDADWQAIILKQQRENDHLQMMLDCLEKRLKELRALKGVGPPTPSICGCWEGCEEKAQPSTLTELYAEDSEEEEEEEGSWGEAEYDL